MFHFFCIIMYLSFAPFELYLGLEDPDPGFCGGKNSMNYALPISKKIDIAGDSINSDLQRVDSEILNGNFNFKQMICIWPWVGYIGSDAFSYFAGSNSHSAKDNYTASSNSLDDVQISDPRYAYKTRI